MIETGTYNEMQSEIHMHPNESVQAQSPKFTDAWWQKLVPTGELALAAE